MSRATGGAKPAEEWTTSHKLGFMTSLPFVAALAGVLVSEWFSDLTVKKGLSLCMTRKLPIMIGLAMPLFMLGANYADSPAWVIVFISIAFFGNGFV